MKNIKQFYKELGKVVYSIAIADGLVQAEERLKLRELVSKDLALHEKTYDTSGMNQAFYVDFEFEEFEKNHPELGSSVLAFNRFIEANIEPGDEGLIRRSLHLMDNIVNAYQKDRERNILEQIKKSSELLMSGLARQKNK